MASVTRFGEISPLCKHIKVFGQFFECLFSTIRQIHEITLVKNYTFGNVFVVGNGQILKNNLNIWSL